jgi:catechol 2,3-dioxygenase-like lactoylglutathione lyase family enzyme
MTTRPLSLPTFHKFSWPWRLTFKTTSGSIGDSRCSQDPMVGAGAHGSGDAMPCVRPERFVHVVYRTRRFETMLDWYSTVFDAKVQHRNPALAFLTYDDEHHRFAFVNLAVLQPEGSEMDRTGIIGVDHLAYTYGSLADLFENYVQLKAHGISPYWCIHHGITVSMYYADPDGNQMELQVDCFRNAEDANAFIEGPHFALNPIGVEFDPEEWLRRLGAGEAAADLLPRSAHLPVSPIRGSAAAGGH